MRLTLKAARQAKNLTQKELGELIGCSKQSIGDLEHGRVEGRVSTWDALERVLKIPAKRLRKVSEQEASNE